MDISLYNYNMNNGIVRQLRENGAEYYINAGEIKQKGIEASIWAYLLPFQNNRFIQRLRFQSAVSYNHYRFGWTNTLNFTFPKQLGLNISHNFTSAMPLNDANTVFSDKFHLVQLKGTWNWNIDPSKQVQFFAGVDNLLNETYSFGNDINAYGNRFFNPAPTRNYYGGVKVIF